MRAATRDRAVAEFRSESLWAEAASFRHLLAGRQVAAAHFDRESDRLWQRGDELAAAKVSDEDDRVPPTAAEIEHDACWSARQERQEEEARS